LGSTPVLAPHRAPDAADLGEAFLETQLGQDVTRPGDLEDLVVVAEQTMSAPAAKGLALAEAACLRVADALDGLARPVVDLLQMSAASRSGNARFGVPASHGCLSSRMTAGPCPLSVIRGSEAEISTREQNRRTVPRFEARRVRATCALPSRSGGRSAGRRATGGRPAVRGFGRGSCSECNQA